MDYRNTEICPYCGEKLKHSPQYWEIIGEVEYGLTCPNCGTIDYYSYGRWEKDNNNASYSVISLTNIFEKE